MLIDDEENIVYKDNTPVLESHEDKPDFFGQIGNNTHYIIHPEEILAENFACLITQEKVSTQSIIDSMKTILKK